MGRLEQKEQLQSNIRKDAFKADERPEPAEAEKQKEPLEKQEEAEKNDIANYYERILNNSLEKNTALRLKSYDNVEKEGWTVVSSRKTPVFQQKLPAARDSYKARKAEKAQKAEAKETFEDADLCTVREKSAMDAYFASWKKGDPGIPGNDVPNDPALMEYVDAILSMELNNSLFTDDYLSDHIAEMFEYARKLRHFSFTKDKYPKFFAHLSDDKKALLETRAAAAVELGKLLTQHMNLHGIKIERDSRGWRTKLRKVSDDKDPKTLKAEYESKLQKLLNDRIYEDEINLAKTYVSLDFFRSGNASFILDKRLEANEEARKTAGEEMNAASEGMKKAWRVRDELIKDQKQLLWEYEAEKDKVKKAEYRVRIVRNNRRIRLASNHADNYRDFIDFATGTVSMIKRGTAKFLEAEAQEGMLKLVRQKLDKTSEKANKDEWEIVDHDTDYAAKADLTLKMDWSETTETDRMIDRVFKTIKREDIEGTLNNLKESDCANMPFLTRKRATALIPVAICTRKWIYQDLAKPLSKDAMLREIRKMRKKLMDDIDKDNKQGAERYLEKNQDVTLRGVESVLANRRRAFDHLECIYRAVANDQVSLDVARIWLDNGLMMNTGLAGSQYKELTSHDNYEAGEFNNVFRQNIKNTLISSLSRQKEFIVWRQNDKTNVSFTNAENLEKGKGQRLYKRNTEVFDEKSFDLLYKDKDFIHIEGKNAGDSILARTYISARADKKSETVKVFLETVEEMQLFDRIHFKISNHTEKHYKDDLTVYFGDNFKPEEIRAFLERFSGKCKKDGGLLLNENEMLSSAAKFDDGISIAPEPDMTKIFYDNFYSKGSFVNKDRTNEIKRINGIPKKKELKQQSFNTYVVDMLCKSAIIANKRLGKKVEDKVDFNDAETMAETKKVFRELCFMNGVDPETLIGLKADKILHPEKDAEAQKKDQQNKDANLQEKQEEDQKVGQQGVNQQEVGKQEIGHQEINQQEINQQEIGQQEINHQEINHQEINQQEAKQEQKLTEEQRAMKIAIQESTVPDMDEETWKKYGGASYNQVVTKAEAEQAVKASNGFLCMKAYERDPTLYVLKPSLPEYTKRMSDQGKNVPLRRTFKAFAKALLQKTTDEKTGAFLKKQPKYKGKLAIEWYDDMMQWMQKGQDYYKPFLDEWMRPAIEEMLKKEYKDGKMKDPSYKAKQDSINIVEDFRRLMDNTVNEFTYGAEVDLDEARRRSDVIRNLDRKKFFADPAIKSIKIDGKPLTEEEMNEALDSFVLDSLNAEKELKKIRDMDLDSEEMFVLNSCKENEHFMRTMMENYIANEEHPGYNYTIDEYTEENAEQVLQFMDKNYEMLADASDIDEKIKAKSRNTINGLKEKMSGGKLSDKDMNDLKLIAGRLSKYEFHKATNICSTGDKIYTIEGYAPETSQYMGSPYSTHNGIGIYRSSKGVIMNNGSPEHEGFKQFYLKDKPFGMSRKDAVKIALKGKLSYLYNGYKMR